MKLITGILIAGAAVAAYFLIVKKGLLTDSFAGTGGVATTPPNSYGITAENTTKENLAMANAAIAANVEKYTTPISQPLSKKSESTTYYTQVQAAAASGKAQITTEQGSGKTVTVGPTGNIYVTDPVTGKGTYTPGPTTKVLGASKVSSSKSSSSSSSSSAAKTTASANRAKALSGPKTSAKGKYTAV